MILIRRSLWRSVFIRCSPAASCFGLIPPLFVYFAVIVQPQKRLSCSVAMMSWYFRSPAWALVGGAGWVDFGEALTVWLKGIQGGAKSRWEERRLCPERHAFHFCIVEERRREKKKKSSLIGPEAGIVPPCTPPPQPHIHLAFPRRPAPVSRQMTQFDTPAGQLGQIMFLHDHPCEK